MLFINSSVKAQLPWNSCDPSPVVAGSPVGPANNVFTKGTSMPTDIMATSIPANSETKATDYTFLVTQADSIVLGATPDGSYDFNVLDGGGIDYLYADGEYWFWGMAYTQTQFNGLAAWVKGLSPSVLTFILKAAGLTTWTDDDSKALQAALPDEPNVAEIIGLMDTFNGENPIKVTSVTTFFNTLNNNGLVQADDVCVAVVDTPYPVQVVSGQDCDANLDFSADQPLTISICPGEAIDLLFDEATVNAGLADNPLLVYLIFDKDPSGKQLFLDVNPLAGSLPPLAGGTDLGSDGYGLGLSNIWVVGAIANIDANGDTTFTIDCFASTENAVAITYLPSSDALCANDDCADALVEFADLTPTYVPLCPGESFSFAANTTTINYGAEPGANPGVIWLFTMANPGGGDPLLVFDPLTDFATFGNITTTSAVIVSSPGLEGKKYYITGILASDIVIEPAELGCPAWTSSVVVDFLLPESLACKGKDCLADYGDVNTSPITTCPDVDFDFSATNFQAGDYTQFYIITENLGGDLVIKAITTATTFNATDLGLAAGTYAIHAFNVANGDVDAVITAITDGVVKEIEDLQGSIDFDVICGEVDGTGVALTVLDANDPACQTGPVCEAEYGTVETVGPITACFSKAADAITITGDNQSIDFVTLFIISQGANSEILNYSSSNIIEPSLSGLNPGTYKVHAFNILFDHVDELNAGLSDETINTVADLVAAIADGLLCAEIDADGIELIVLSDDDPACTGGTVCEADYGTATTGAQIVCANGVTEPIVYEGAATGDYLTVYAITTGAELTLVNYTISNIIDAGALGLTPGNYTIHALNVLGADIPTLQAAIADGTIKTGFDAAGFIVEGLVCAELDMTGISLTVLTPVSVEVKETCIEINGNKEITVAFYITGGYPEMDASSLYNITEDFNGAWAYGDTLKLVKNEGEAYNITVTDDYGCTTSVLGEATCLKCTNNAGTMEMLDLQYVCNDGSISVETIGEEVSADAKLIYVVHDNAGNSLGNILAIDNDGNAVGTFTLADIAGGQTNTVYYVSAVVGNTIDGEVDFTDACTVFALPGTPIVFLAPIVVSVVSTECDDNQNGVVTFSVTGGLPSFDANATYTTNGSVSGTFGAGQLIATGSLADGDSYSLNVNDGICESSINGFVKCAKCGNQPGTYAIGKDNPVVSCSGGSASIVFDGILVDSDSQQMYVLMSDMFSAPADVLANAIKISADGTFDSEGLACGTSYYVTSIVGPVDGNGAMDPVSNCTKVSGDMVQLIFACPMTIDVDVNCDKVTGCAVYTVAISGGSAPYSVTGAIAVDNVGELENLSFTLCQDGKPWNLNVTDAIGCGQETSGVENCEKTTAIELISFTGKALDHSNQLNWETANELANEYFVLSRSFDGQNFTNIAQVKGAGTTNMPTQYQYNDNDVKDGFVYYQLHSVNINNEITKVDQTVVLKRGQIVVNPITVSPVPTKANLDIAVTATQNGFTNVIVADVSGKIVLDRQMPTVIGKNTLNINVANLPAGVYFVTVKDDANNSVAKFVKE
ncbi:MAG: T9SS type A sorting domain-containing protein [Sphingobacteriales bacterium]|nr:T9SS type A sorting domain-containing protein [Sphingobacteriales bacterium]MBK8677674.1 T9SS type A sorting domain-containing protein [Sphingobacteriales bacterium]MBL0247680.1 T9SS type A sorting domain-containing protein [Sphingobacteriales bacterium]